MSDRSNHTSTPLQRRLEALADLVAELGPDIAAEAPALKAAISDEMAEIVLQSGGAQALVAQYGADERIGVVRPLAFQLAVAVNDRARAHGLSATVFSMVERLRTLDPWPRLNLCTAVQRLMMFRAALPTAGSPPAIALARLLREALQGPPEVRATAATVVADVFYGKRTEILEPVALAELRDKVLAFVGDEDELTRKEAEGLREFLGEGGT